MEWLGRHGSALQTLFSGAMVVIWIAYLQVFLRNLQRQRRADILINMGAGVGLKARCFISNLSLEPIYLLEVLVEIETQDDTRQVAITDRTEMTDEQLRDPSEATNQGPLNSGAFIDIGDFETLIERASSSDYAPDPVNDIRTIEITAVALSAAERMVIGAKRKYVVVRDTDGRVVLRPVTIAATQIVSRKGRRTLRRALEENLAD